MRRIGCMGSLLLLACGPQVAVDDAGMVTDGGTVGSGDDDGISPGDETTTPAPSTTATPVPPDPTTPTSASASATMTTTSATSASTVVTTDEPPPPPGGACEDHFDCPTLLCFELSDAPADPDAYCENAPANGATRFSGTVRSISTQTPVPNAYVVVASALNALTNPAMATPLAEGFTARGGLLDVTSPQAIAAQIGAVALVDAPGFYLSATGVAAPQDDGTYLPGNDVHDVWLVATEDLDLWSEQLAADPGIDPAFLPLGDAGGFVGLVRDPAGAPHSGVVVASAAFESTAIVRYPSPEGMQTSATSELGLFVIMNPALAESFSVESPSGETTTLAAGSTSGAVFTAGVILQ